jgi:hypothetical protein
LLGLTDDLLNLLEDGDELGATTGLDSVDFAEAIVETLTSKLDDLALSVEDTEIDVGRAEIVVNVLEELDQSLLASLNRRTGHRATDVDENQDVLGVVRTILLLSLIRLRYLHIQYYTITHVNRGVLGFNLVAIGLIH